MSQDEVPEGTESISTGERSRLRIQLRTAIESHVSTLPLLQTIRTQRTLIGVITVTLFYLKSLQSPMQLRAFQLPLSADCYRLQHSYFVTGSETLRSYHSPSYWQ